MPDDAADDGAAHDAAGGGPEPDELRLPGGTTSGDKPKDQGGHAAAAGAASAAADTAAIAAAAQARQKRALALLSLGIFGVLSIWYVGSAVLPLMRADTALRPDGLTNAEGALLTSAANVGFVVGCIGSALVNLSDLVRPAVLVLIGAVAAAAITAASCLDGVSFELVLVSRCLVGVCIALVYPPSMKLLATWYEPEKRGAAIGILFAFFCIGSAFPQLLKALAGDTALGSWRFPLLVTSGVTASAGVLVYLGVGEGPFPFPPAPKLQPSQTLEVLRTPSVALPILGYVGHQIEVMNMWGWLGEFLVQVHGMSETNAGLLAFVAISMGGPGSFVGGWLGDKYGRAKVCSIALVISGSSCLCVGLIADLPLWLTVIVVIIWGLTVLADSPNFPSVRLPAPPRPALPALPALPAGV
jgi:MFS family permease